VVVDNPCDAMAGEGAEAIGIVRVMEGIVSLSIDQ
jgi:hypothetical protein